VRKSRNYDAELNALDKAKQLRQKRLPQLGELVTACAADSLSLELLAVALLDLKNVDAATTEGWRQRGAAFFQPRPANQLTATIICHAAQKRMLAARHRLEARRARATRETGR